jgi:hypothetical protein
MRHAAKRLAAGPKGRYIPAMHIARLYAHAGEKDQALDALEDAFHERSPSMGSLNVDPDWDVLRGGPRYEDLLRRLNLPP